MTRGGKARDRTDPERRCIVTGASGPTDLLTRFVRGPGDMVVPDLAARLPGRGVWLTTDRAMVEKAVAKRLFSRAFRAQVTTPPDLPALLERLLAERLLNAIALARKAGKAVTGYEKTRAALKSGQAGVLIQAADGSVDGREKLRRVAPGLPCITVLDSGELGLAFGRDFAIHAALDKGGFADRAVLEANRLGGMRLGAGHDTGQDRLAGSGPDVPDPEHTGDRTGPLDGLEQDCE